MKIGIIGNYGHHNNGDEAILMGILKQLTEELAISKTDIVIFSHNPENTEERYGVRAIPLLSRKKSLLLTILATLKANYLRMKELDVLIIGGGGLLMDLYKRDAPLYATLGMLGHYAGCKVVIYGVGAGPIRTKAGAFFIKQLLKKAQQISVRDESSRKLLQSLQVKKEIEVIGDPALFLARSSKKMQRDSVRQIAVTAVPYYSSQYWPTTDEQKYQQYISGMAQNLDELIRQKGVHITFFSTKYPQDVQVTKDIASFMQYRDKVVIIDQNLYPSEILSLCESHDLVIGTRLHSLILGIAAKTPVIGVGYHPKVQHFLTAIQQLDRYIAIEKLAQDDQLMLQMVNEIEKNWPEVQQRIELISENMKNEAEKGIQLLQRIIGEKHV
ncbi:polysaccharide pyruvyl transferase family protein [Anoxybacillus sp. B7M1]|jgi:polysaccharide pyruvyl transferase CsaB|uniref:Polysaccharide pyruvyl transferase family protein n=1 Tax=Anoxybacteroides rupiense TaxID=311460 RepID=A0ABD5IUW2_9BACL|nr:MULTISPECIES: polysaccharide pyruvyl transferase family protein [Anoxybacillus]ANB56614.1 polysaccharide pyruvyl transferase family protein [Anoxybacillus sp. B2M1]ANB63602.1 polysaccharide pyruvyl transferase family protein [Anoxybacillus sp. B7M1]MBB3908567.1 polysaccharide pyruvyl transferase CsaB [Anoxybacillus rupiensis]MED5051746.1 polysaccharide pyruvyl transferase family protein [Anoxybacillus rupiensis]OQM46921.1 polysaccharide pyruvyl transferase [Anoxybacillus sp. UARK-01]